MSHDDLIATLTDPDLETRQSAFDDIFTEMDDALALSIAGIATSDRAADVRADAIVALGPLIEECSMEYDEGMPGDSDVGVSEETFHAVVGKLRALYDDAEQPKLVRRRAFEALVRDPQPWQEEEIRNLLASADEDWRLTALFGMGELPGFEQDVLDAVNARKGVELEEAVRAAAKMQLRKAAPKIRDLAKSGNIDRDLRVESILALPHVDPDAFDLLEQLRGSNDEEVAEAAQEAIEELLMREAAEEEFGGDGD